MSTETNDGGNEKDIFTLVQTPIPAIDPMDMPSETASASSHLTARKELTTGSKKGDNEKEILSLISTQTPIPAFDPMDATPGSSIGKQGRQCERNSTPLNETSRTPNNEISEDLNVRPGAYYIPGTGASGQEDTNSVEIPLVATPVANRNSSLRRSIINHFVIAIPLHQTLVNFKDKRVQLALFIIAVVFTSFSLALGLLLNKGNSARNTSSELISYPPTIAVISSPQNNQTIATSDVSTAQSNHFATAYPSDALSSYPTYIPSMSPTAIRILSTDTAMDIFVPLSGEESLKNKTSPQYLAMDWITNQDGANMTLKEVDKIRERYALAVFYYSTQGESWKHQYNFLSDKDVCEWKGYDAFNDWSGVQGCNKAGNVVHFDLFFENITGTIPSELGLLTELMDLNLAINNLYGEVPVSLSNISTLNEMYLHWNDLTGSMEHFCTNNKEYIHLSADCFSRHKKNKTGIECSCCDACSP
mmetsp:Transcript_28613/g.34918  ORF Transcript_28613/g.34918 Transcript_28613/m.34918 type:complete len:475 (+) Transcript_28613:110-1534(+)